MIRFAFLITILFFGIYNSSYCIDHDTTYTSSNRMIKSGIFLNFGIAYPVMFVPGTYKSISNNYNVEKVYVEERAVGLGVQPNFEFGSQWYFYANNKWGIGCKVSWFQIGFSSSETSNSDLHLDLRVLKFAPQFTWSINREMVFDFSLESSPTVMAGRRSYYPLRYSGFGVLIAPGIKFRYKTFAVGFDLSLGLLSTTYEENYTKFIETFIFKPRIFLGLKF